ncbi:DUF4129 domain-containing protein [Halostella litorea]|uniref:DUF4129 domain-containing protein n=1 Tax=Halostella litorea TaxID=2528831 RepID=UPI001091C63A|nr:DUF4129 domain-containing protein [Halostella litorea]
MPSTRTVAGVALALAVGSVAAAATAVEASIAPALDSPRSGRGGGGGGSLYGLLLLLLTRVLAVFGIHVELGGGGAPSFLPVALRWLAANLPALLGAVALLAVVALAVRYRDGVVAATRSVRSRSRSPASGDGRSDWSPGDPSNAVEAAWVELVSRADAARPASRTPAEWERAGVDSGLPAAAVDRAVSLFRAVRYGGRPVTDERAARAETLRRRLAGDGETATDAEGPSETGSADAAASDRAEERGGDRGDDAVDG